MGSISHIFCIFSFFLFFNLGYSWLCTEKSFQEGSGEAGNRTWLHLSLAMCKPSALLLCYSAPCLAALTGFISLGALCFGSFMESLCLGTLFLLLLPFLGLPLSLIGFPCWASCVGYAALCMVLCALCWLWGVSQEDWGTPYISYYRLLLLCVFNLFELSFFFRAKKKATKKDQKTEVSNGGSPMCLTHLQ